LGDAGSLDGVGLHQAPALDGLTESGGGAGDVGLGRGEALLSVGVGELARTVAVMVGVGHSDPQTGVPV
jgi:hypothetical protein